MKLSNYHKMRKNYDGAFLDRQDLLADPFQQFDDWFQMAINENVPEPNAMSLSTVDEHSRPSSRMLLLKEFDEKGFIFFTNYHSHKAHDLEKNPIASLLFWWQPLRRQVRIRGFVEKASKQISDDYFFEREKASNIGAMASRQSEIIQSREFLISRYAEIEKQYENVQHIPRPDFWGGYILIPSEFEFWQGALNRLHDRFLYQKIGDNWTIERLSP